MMGMRMPETCWAVFKWQAIKLRDWCIWLVDLFECHWLFEYSGILVYYHVFMISFVIYQNYLRKFHHPV
jgi:hypothetical protein